MKKNHLLSLPTGAVDLYTMEMHIDLIGNTSGTTGATSAGVDDTGQTAGSATLR